MELKSYQKRAIEDLNSYLYFLSKEKSLEKAWESFWGSKGEKVGNGIDFKGVRKYTDTIKQVPNICAKIPTAGGKTFLACASIKVICDEVYKEQKGKPKFVIFLVPSEAILSQSLKNLKNQDHPYRMRLNTDFGNSVSVFDASNLNDGLNENTLSELNIAVLSFASLRTKDKNIRKLYQENGSLYSLKDRIKDKLEDSDEMSVVNVLRSFQPIVIVDESHNAKTELSLAMLKDLNASFIYELTATPKESSNVIHITKASELKKDNMVKLPVFLYNLPSSNDVILNAISIRHKLEEQAKNESLNVRPIVLFQANSGTDDKKESFEKIKQKLISYGIPATQIAIKTANINEIAGIDLMKKECGIRYIITINALKEGWDCPNAYVLASLANRNSKTDVEQLIGRVLRQPYATRCACKALNASYVLTSSNNFNLTAENVVVALNGAGFSRDDFRQEDFAKNTEVKKGKKPNDDADLFAEFNNDEKYENKEYNNEEYEDDDNVDVSSEVINIAESGEQKYVENIQNEEEIVDGYKIKFEVPKLPVFVRKMSNLSTLFGDEYSYELFEPAMLDNDFKISDKDRQINFDSANIELIYVDTDENEIPQYQHTSNLQKNDFVEFFKTCPPESKTKHCVDKIYYILNNNRSFDGIDSGDLKRYIELVIGDLTSEQVAELPDKKEIYAELIGNKIKALRTEFRQKRFYELLDTHKIEVRAEFSLKKAIKPKESNATRPKSLYEEEISKLNDFERRLLDAIVACDNIKWWHRNADRDEKYFHINGFINHYPDFLAATKSGKIVAVEAKGDDRTNDDSKAKLKLGKKWADKAGSDFEYYMVFDKNKIEDAYTINEFINILSRL